MSHESAEWNYLSIPKLQQLEIDMHYHLMLYNEYNWLSMPRFKLNHVESLSKAVIFTHKTSYSSHACADWRCEVYLTFVSDISYLWRDDINHVMGKFDWKHLGHILLTWMNSNPSVNK